MVSVVVLTKFLELPYNHFLTLYLTNCLLLFHSDLFLEMSPLLSFGACFFVSPFWLLLVCFHLLGRYAMTPTLGRVALCQNVLWDSVAQSP